MDSVSVVTFKFHFLERIIEMRTIFANEKEITPFLPIAYCKGSAV